MASDPITLEQRKQFAKSVSVDVRRITAAISELEKAGISRRALIVWIADISKVNRPTIAKVLDGLDDLEEYVFGGDDG